MPRIARAHPPSHGSLLWRQMSRGLVREAFNGAPVLVGVNVVRPVGRSTLTPPARRRRGAAVPRNRMMWEGHVGRVTSLLRVREVAYPKSRCPGVRSVALDFVVAP